MNKLAFNLCACLVALLCMATFSSCGNKNNKALLETVPSEASFVVLMDANKCFETFDIEYKDDDLSYDKDVKKLMDAANLSKREIKEVKQVLELACLTKRSVVVFEYEKEPYITFLVDDEKEFIKKLEDLEDANISFDEEKGFQTDDNIAIKDNQVWYSPDLDINTVKSFLKLDDKKKFTEVYSEITDQFLGSNVTCAVFVDIESAVKLMGYDAQNISLAMSVAFKDACYLVGIGTLTDSESTAEIRVLNSKFEAAKFNFPLAKLEASDFSRINGNAAVIGAIGIDPKTVDKIVELGNKYNAFSSSDIEIFNVLKTLKGGTAFSFANMDDIAVSIGFDKASSAKEFGNLFTQGFTLNGDISYADSKLIFRTRGSKAAKEVQVPAGLPGNYAAVYVDFAKIDKDLIPGLDTSKLGKMYITIEPDGDGIKMVAKWEVKNPLKTSVTWMLDVANSGVDIDDLMPSSYDYYDEVEAVETAYYDPWAESAVVAEEAFVYEGSEY